VAVIQISKIQVRRGQKNSNSGVPQLSSAEFAWAVDTQELFIGNGSVAEGAPYVGNTKILTEHDNILDIAASYQYSSTDPSITLSIPRSLQTKLDEYVSVTDFGAVADGSTDNTEAFETAFSQLFNNANPNYKKVLMVPNGEYLFLSDLTIPDGVIMRGETQLGAILNFNDFSVQFSTASGQSIIDFNSTNRPENIHISNLTIQRQSGQIVLSGVGNSVFDNVKFKGDYVLGNTATLSLPAALYWENNVEGIKVTDIKFNDCIFESNAISVKCVQTIATDTDVQFNNCKFFINDTGIYIQGVTTQKNYWRINDCKFEEVAGQAFRSTAGQGTVIQRSRFVKVGNGTNLSSNPLEPMVYFGENISNVLIDCSSDRQQSAGTDILISKASVTEVEGSSKSHFLDRNYSLVRLTDSFRPLAVFSAFNRYIKINYFLSLDVWSRVGTLTLSIGDGLQEIAVTDSFQYSTPLAIDQGGQVMTKFEFNAELRDNDTDSGIDTVVLSYKNPVATGAAGTISFDVTYGV